ncbi:autotransporter outer membrane beta-barrel domain-containing protein [[Clostridium] fimetarium]|uniref:Uncharacterized protein n=1 Tax=[Clostridium] fimetarium TaxID=99656 RepID=A0A1I0RDQ8_9FIRM|nr:hypothetical protein [[Clostridium] fimetarium]SEW38802.1 hypothetical protein SAMN05421659_11442 [[Clostridium] fimetarium]
MKSKHLKRALSSALAGVLIASSIFTGSMTVKAVDTSVTDGSISVAGIGSTEAALGSWVTLIESPTVYRIYPCVVPDPDSLTDNNTLGYDNFYRFRDIAVYEVSGSKTDAAESAYFFTSSTSQSAQTLGETGLILGENEGNNFEELGLSLNLPTQGFSLNNPSYTAFSDNLSSQITTDENGNVQDILANYIATVDARQGSLSDEAKDDLTDLKSISGYGTDNYSQRAKNVGLCIEVCSVGLQVDGGQGYLFSYGDLLATDVRGDAYGVYDPLNSAEKQGKLLSWSASYNLTSGASYSVNSEYNGMAVFLSYNLKSPKDIYSQSVNGTLMYTDDVKANVSTSTENSLGITTSAYASQSNSLSDLGSDSYKAVVNNALASNEVSYAEKALYSAGNTYNNSLVGSAGSTKSNNALGISSSSDMNYGLNGFGNLNDSAISKINNGLYLMGYSTVALNIGEDALSLGDLYSAKGSLQKVLSNAKAKTVASTVDGANAFGSSYQIKFYADDSKNSVVNAYTDAITSNSSGLSYTNASLQASQKASYSNGNVDSQVNSSDSANLLANLQASTLLSGSVEGNKANDVYTDATGTIYATLSYMVKKTYVSSNLTQVTIDQSINDNGDLNVNVNDVKATQTADYLVEANKEWNVSDSNQAYAIIYRTSDYNMKDANSLVSQMVSGLSDSIFDEEGASVLASRFQKETGANVQGFKYLGTGVNTSVTVGSTTKEGSDDLTGLSVLVVCANRTIINTADSTDSLASNEINYVYPNLLGEKSNKSGITSFTNLISGIQYPETVKDNNKGDLTDYKGTNALHYSPSQGLFGVSAQSPKDFDSASFPSYAYSISRGLWNDNLVLSNYRGVTATDNGVQEYVKNTLGMKIGIKGIQTGVSAGENVDATLLAKKFDRYIFSGSMLRKITDNSTESVSVYDTYKVTHSCNKYDSLDLDTASNSNDKSVAFSVTTCKWTDNVLSFVTQSDKTLAMYGEVPYKMYYPTFSSTGILASVAPTVVYAMSEKVRSMTPSSIRGYSLNCDSVAATGKADSETTATGTAAKKLSDKFGGLQIVYAGGSIHASAKDNIEISLISYSLDLSSTEVNGKSLKESFAAENINYKPQEEHEAYVDAFKSQLITSPSMKVYESDNVTVRNNNLYYVLTYANETKVIKDTVSSSIALEFKNGVLTDASKNNAVTDIASAYGISEAEATQMFNNSGIEQQVKDTFEDSLDSNNSSKNKWYTEDSITIVLNKYVTVVQGGDLLVDDKIDITAGPSQNIYSATHNFENGFKSEWFISLSLPEEFVIGDKKYNLEGNNIIIKDQLIVGSAFVISDATTADMKK